MNKVSIKDMVEMTRVANEEAWKEYQASEDRKIFKIMDEIILGNLKRDGVIVGTDEIDLD